MMQSFEAQDGARLVFDDEGEGYPLLGLAGLTRDARDFDYLAPHLPKQMRFIRLDARGRGRSQWTGAASYTLAQEADDVLRLLDVLDLPQVAIIGSSRGGLLGMFLAATHPDRVKGLCFIDVGPQLNPEGMKRIAQYVGVKPDLLTLEEIALRMPKVKPGFEQVSASRWSEEAQRHYVQCDDHVCLPYDPEIRTALLAALEAPPVDLWPLFDACKGLPLAVIRAQHSDVLARETVFEMQRRVPELCIAEIPKRGHVPFLDEPESLDCIHTWIDKLC